MICDKCRTLNPNENTKCVHCGEDLKAPEIKENVPKSLYHYGSEHHNYTLPHPNHHGKAKKEKKKIKSSSIILIAVLIAVFIIFYQQREMAVSYWQSNIKQFFIDPESLLVKSSLQDSNQVNSVIKTVSKNKNGEQRGQISDKEVDYYTIMREKGISESSELTDTTVYESRSHGASAQQLRKKIRREGGAYFGNDNKLMVLVPAQTFIMGSNTGSGIESPAFEVSINAFFIDAHEVTNTEFKKFLNLSGYKPKGSLAHLHDTRFNDPKQPVVDVEYDDALAYAEWVGKRLLTEEEWECAAKGGKQLVYPVGNTISHDKAVYGQKSFAPSIVGSFRANVYGIYDLAGNVAELVAGTLKSYHGNRGYKNEFSKYRLCRGGSWISSPDDLKCTRRIPVKGGSNNGNIGFRCAISAE